MRSFRKATLMLNMYYDEVRVESCIVMGVISHV